MSLFKMFLLGLLRALLSSAQTPMVPRGGLLFSSLSSLVDLSLPGLALLVVNVPLILLDVLVRLLDRATPATPVTPVTPG
jgi:hypothetical protein